MGAHGEHPDTARTPDDGNKPNPAKETPGPAPGRLLYSYVSRDVKSSEPAQLHTSTQCIKAKKNIKQTNPPPKTAPNLCKCSLRMAGDLLTHELLGHVEELSGTCQVGAPRAELAPMATAPRRREHQQHNTGLAHTAGLGVTGKHSREEKIPAIWGWNAFSFPH